MKELGYSGIGHRLTTITNLPVALILIIFFLSFPIAVSNVQAYADNERVISVTNCGPAVLKKVFDRYGIATDVPELIGSTHTAMGRTTMKEMAAVLNKRGLHASAIIVTYADLQELAKTHAVIAHFSKNSHYIVVEGIQGGKVKIYNPAIDPCEREIYEEIFTADWSGKVIVVSKEPVEGALYGRSLTEEEMSDTVGGVGCNNGNAPSGTNSKKKKTKEPVQINNGDLTVDSSDMSIESRGIPFGVDRHYSAQVISLINGWKMEKGAGPWNIEEGELSGYGDRIINDADLTDCTVEADMKTVSGGTEIYHVGWINIRYTDENNRYYFLIKKGGVIELAKYLAGKQYIVSTKQTLYDPLKWNQVKIAAVGKNIKVYVNNILEIDVIDKDRPIVKGKIVLEACFSNARFDNVKITAGGKTTAYNFDIDDNNTMFGYGWTTLYDMKITVMANGDVIVLREDGEKDRFAKGTTGYAAPAGVYDTLTKDLAGYLLRRKGGMVYRFDVEGKIMSITDPNGNQMSMGYTLVNQQ